MVKLIVFAVLALPSISSASLTVINLNDFIADTTVNIASDGNSAIISEDPLLSPVIVSNDPALGDQEVIIAGNNRFLLFEYDFQLGDDPNSDEFGAFVIDPQTGNGISGFEFFTATSGSGTVSFDLTPLVGQTGLGLQFQITALPLDGAFDSTVTVSNVRLQVIPLPPALPLFGLSVLGCFVFRIKRSFYKFLDR